MTDESVISEYSDRQAIEDGVLLPWPWLGEVNRISRAVFYHFVRNPEEACSVIEAVLKLKPLYNAVQAMLRVKPDARGWRTGRYRGKELWVVPNEVGGATLLFPEDY